MSKPFIGITPEFEQKETRQFFYLNYSYARAVINAGGIPIVIPGPQAEDDYTEILKRLNGIIFSGGNDHNPALWGEEMHPQTKLLHEHRQNYEIMLGKLARKLELPTLGICGGHQTINIVYGGSLIQDIPDITKTTILHSQKETRNIPTHKVILQEDTKLFRIMQKKEIMSNSFHHQAVNRLGDGLRITARAEDGIVEAIETTDDRFVIGVQWHPEELYEMEEHFALFKALIKAASR